MTVLSLCATAVTLAAPLLAAAPQVGSSVKAGNPADDRGVVAFPMDLMEADGPLGSYELAPRASDFASLMAYRELSMPGVPIPGGESLVLDLQRVDFDFASLGVHVNGEKALWDSGDLTLWTGSVLGDPFSEVTIGFSSLGTYGWIATGGETWHVGANAGLAGDWSAPGCRIWAESVSAELRDSNELPQCVSEGLWASAGQAPLAPVSGAAPGSGARGSRGVLSECKVAVETDYQLFQLFNNLAAEQNYIGMLLAAISNRYETEVDVVLTFPYLMYHSNSNDGWVTADNGGNSGAMLGEFRAAWQGNIPAGANLAHFVSGANLGGGVAYLNVLCNQDFGFGVSGNLGASVNFPVTQGSGNWDFMVIAHELGHNFSAPHTHDYCPPLDQCAPNGYFGQCQNQQSCTNQGTIMSYCHLCSGGVSNITTFFHPTVQQTIRDGVANSCLPVYQGGCGTDALEDNDDCSSAVVMMGGTTSGLTVSKLDPDFYSVTVQGGATLTASALFAHATADIDIYLYDPLVSCGDINSYLARGFSSSDDETVSWTNSSFWPATYTLEVQVFANSGGECSDYTLVLDPGQGTGVGVNYCGPGVFNSTGQTGRIVAQGSALVTDNDVTLTGTQLPPGSLGYFLVSNASGFVANPGGSSGNLCLFPPFGRYVQFAGPVAANGTRSLTIDLTGLPQPTSTVAVQSGDTWYFQFWHRDALIGIPTSNFTDGIGITFQ
ncbi:hypothetical protein Poly30_14510 [Planctomycetes bacterium Poly30]|uniref:Peptidase M12B domain-containing protein n=1 Tax=Saltatorellus ferox TaxID=2528018 RepID=A0A518EPD6_9BACT|nr:hypothetical protein Poly30_14510 [Planctomycetes bacterium Poly30]